LLHAVPPAAGSREIVPAAGVAAAGVVSALLATGRIPQGSSAAFALAVGSVLVGVVATGVAAYRRAARSPRLLGISPFAIAAATWLVLFVVRPVELYFAPDHSAISLGELGFAVSDLTRSVAIAGVGIAAWGAGYLVGFGTLPPRAAETTRGARPNPLSTRGSSVALAIGTLLWVPLFLRQGGVGALIHSPASIRNDQTSSFYAFVGLWMINGVGLYALARILRTPTRQAKRVLVASAVLAVAAAACLQVRGALGFTVLAGVAIYLEARRPTRRQLAFGIATAVAAGGLLLMMAQFRAYSTTASTRDALTLLAKTPPSAYVVSDLSTFDNFVAVQELVPGSIDYLHGESFEWIPELLVPRSLWPAKPLGLDFLISAYVYPGVFVGTPISLQGELYWNGGVWVVAVGALVVGLLMGLLGRWGLGHARGRVGFILYAVMLIYTHAYLTRSLGTMTSGLVLALIGISIAVAAASRWSPRAAAASARSRIRWPRGRQDRRPGATVRGTVR